MKVEYRVRCSAVRCGARVCEEHSSACGQKRRGDAPLINSWESRGSVVTFFILHRRVFFGGGFFFWRGCCWTSPSCDEIIFLQCLVTLSKMKPELNATSRLLRN